MTRVYTLTDAEGNIYGKLTATEAQVAAHNLVLVEQQSPYWYVPLKSDEVS